MSSEATPRRTSSRRRPESMQLASALEGTEAATPPVESEIPQPSTSAEPMAGALTRTTPPDYSMRNRPIDPSQIDVSYTVSIAGTRPVMRSPQSGVGLDIRSKRMIHNRPIAPNETEDSNTLMGYLD
jgi:hypothetical protein